MKPSRRGFLTGLVGAAAAGPATLASAAQSFAGRPIAAGTLTGLYPGNSVGQAISSDGPYDHRGYLLKQVQRLRGMTRAEIKDEYSYMIREVDQFEIDALRSISARHKLAMLHDRTITRRHQSDIKDALRELLRMDAK